MTTARETAATILDGLSTVSGVIPGLPGTAVGGILRAAAAALRVGHGPEAVKAALEDLSARPVPTIDLDQVVNDVLGGGPLEEGD
jgi:hypothetical protein